MNKNIAIICAILLATALFAWGGEPTSREHSTTTPISTRWEYKQIQGLSCSLLKPSTDEDGQFDEKATDEIRKGIASTNSVFEKEFNVRLKQAGLEGWELVSVTSASNESDTVMTVHSTAYLKRPAK